MVYHSLSAIKIFYMPSFYCGKYNLRPNLIKWKIHAMEDEKVFEKYGEVPLYFSHYYNFLFIFKSAVLETGEQIFLQLGGNMEKVSALVVDVSDPMTLNENGEDEIAFIKNELEEVIWKQEPEV